MPRRYAVKRAFDKRDLIPTISHMDHCNGACVEAFGPQFRDDKAGNCVKFGTGGA